MDTKMIQKNYTRLSANERFSLLFQANQRGDDKDRAALLNTTPAKTWKVPTTRGLGEAFDFMAMCYVIGQLETIATLYHLLLMTDKLIDTAISKLENNGMDITVILRRRILTEAEAWRVLCEEYKVDPERMLTGLPIDTIKHAELLATIASVNDDAGLTELDDYLNGWREVIETKRKAWE